MSVKSKEKTTKCPYPFVICDESGKIIYKNKPFDRIFAVRLSDSIELVIEKDIADRIRYLTGIGCFDFFPDRRAEGFCGLFYMPAENGFAVIFLPEYLSPILNAPDQEINRSVMNDIANAECSEYKADAVIRIRSCALKLLSMYSCVIRDVKISELVSAVVERISSCAAPLGVRISGKVTESKGFTINSHINGVISEILLLFEAAYYSSNDGKIEFFSSFDFGKYYFGFSSENASEDMSAFVLAEENFLKSIASINGHIFSVTKEGTRTTRMVAVETSYPTLLRSCSEYGFIANFITSVIDF